MAHDVFRCARCRVWTGESRHLLDASIACDERELQTIDGVINVEWTASQRTIQLKRTAFERQRILTLDEESIRTIGVYSPSPFSMTVIIQVDVTDKIQQCFLLSHVSNEKDPEDVDHVLRLNDHQEMLVFLTALHNHLKMVPLSSEARAFLAQKRTQDSRIGGKSSLLKRRRSISSTDFYGSTSKTPAFTPPSKRLSGDSNAWSTFYERLQYNVSHSLMCQLEGMAPLSASFPRQQEAFEFADQVMAFRKRLPQQMQPGVEEPRVFCFEGANGGKRQFWVTTLGAFWKEYTAIPEGSRHVYEIIREGVPCRLYFDLEFKKKLNPELDGDALVTRLISLVQLQLYRSYDLLIDRDKHIVQLESSTVDKFSRHLTIHFPNGELFVDNIHAGAFVRQLVHELITTTDENSLFLVQDSTIDGDQRQLFIDVGVYTRNRMFRVLGSSKFRKTAVLRPLQPTPTCPEDSVLDHDLFLRSLVCPCGTKPRSESSIRLLRCDDAVSLKRYTSSGGLRGPMQSMRSVESRVSIYPALDAFIRAIATTGGPQGEIRAVHLLYVDDTPPTSTSPQPPIPAKIVYHMMKNRWCENIGRAHKSNNVMFVVDVIRREYVQRCHDPHCQAMDYRSPSRPLPLELDLSSHVTDLGVYHHCVIVP